ncbi:MAG: HAD family hydrolase [Micromonosporaceae bacterium]
MPYAAHRPPLEAVLFDFHGTLAMVEDPSRCVTLAAAACGVALGAQRRDTLAAAMARVGLATGWPPPVIPPGLEAAWERRDLSSADHRALFVGVAGLMDSGIPGLPEAMYDRLLDPDGWLPYADTLPVLAALRERGIATALVSNIGFDVRPIGKAYGFAELLDAWVLSYEVGVCKPDPAIFRHACAELGVDPRRTLMVGDTVADAAAVEAGCRALVLPTSPPGVRHGLDAVLGMLA